MGWWRALNLGPVTAWEACRHQQGRGPASTPESARQAIVGHQPFIEALGWEHMLNWPIVSFARYRGSQAHFPAATTFGAEE